MGVDDHRYGEGTKTEMDKFMADAAHDHEIDLDTLTGGIVRRSQPAHIYLSVSPAASHMDG